jgi:hypothetical protein
VPGAGRISGEGPFSARTIGVHYSPPSRRGCNRAMLSHPPAEAGMHQPGTLRGQRPPTGPVRHPLVRALALHGVARRQPRSHLASPLTPGRGVLIRSVSRRVGSVACVREDASPIKVSVLHSVLSMPADRRICQAYGQAVPLVAAPQASRGRRTAVGPTTGARPGARVRNAPGLPPSGRRNGMKAKSGCHRKGRTLQRGHATSGRLAEAAGRSG